ncbi:hypothetical protein B0H13DRAFT_1916663 [Mycena leptocephala]|nr:hypothetical protein B0H13DRAFT_1916663 [Mycena leptocephala]
MAHERRMRNSCASGDDRDGRGGGWGEDPEWEDDGLRAIDEEQRWCLQKLAGDAGIERNAAQREAGSGRSSARKRYRLSHRPARLVSPLVDEACGRRLHVFVFDPALRTPPGAVAAALPVYSGYCVQFSITFEELGRAALALTPGMSSVVAPRLVRAVRGRVRWWCRSGHRVSGGAVERGWCRRIAGSRAAGRGARRGRALTEVIEGAMAETASASAYHEVLDDVRKEGLFAILTTVGPVCFRTWGAASARYRHCATQSQMFYRTREGKNAPV